MASLQTIPDNKVCYSRTSYNNLAFLQTWMSTKVQYRLSGRVSCKVANNNFREMRSVGADIRIIVSTPSQAQAAFALSERFQYAISSSTQQVQINILLLTLEQQLSWFFTHKRKFLTTSKGGQLRSLDQLNGLTALS